ncbi:MAG: site-specific DNA-methyltransferase, partial [Anaerolinea sp.]|nr:site-specific DNA-methyltransferase [Anaerolinea sp.]
MLDTKHSASSVSIGDFAHLQCVAQADILLFLRNLNAGSQDYIILSIGLLQRKFSNQEIQVVLDECIRVLRVGGLLFIHGSPEYLPKIGVYLDGRLHFRYWIAVEGKFQERPTGYPTAHMAVLLFHKGNSFRLNKVRFAHRVCRACGKSLRDWGGKSHLMNPDGVAISDVWRGLNQQTGFPYSVWEVLVRLVGEDKQGLLLPAEVYSMDELKISQPRQPYLPTLQVNSSALKSVDYDNLWNVVYQGDALQILRQYPDCSVDLVFADPPYNLDKQYSTYDDELNWSEYIEWCNAWLKEYVRILKPSGSLYVLNLPRWSMYHADFLNQYLYFQNWIVWDALSEPRGQLMPAHYSLLFYTKHPTDFTFNGGQADLKWIEERNYCLRASCIRHRKQQGDDDKELLTDIWSDIHRLKHRRDRDYHPCQLPDKLLERIILTSSNPGDVVLDALAGTGTTAVVSAR